MNEKIHAVNDEFEELTGTFTVACECADAGCLEMLEIPAETYRAVRESPYLFVVLPGHVYPDVEVLVAEHATHAVVEMTGPSARRILEETAPARSRDDGAR